MKKLLLTLLLVSPCLAEGEKELAKCLTEKGFVLYSPKDNSTVHKKWLEKQLNKFAPFQSEIKVLNCLNKENTQDPICNRISALAWVKNGEVLFDGNYSLVNLSKSSGCNIESIKRSNSFRNSNWGDSKEKVKQSEKSSPITEDSDALVYLDTLFGYNWQVLYIFVNDKLVRSKYVLKDTFTNNSNYLNPFLTAGKELGAKYKKPSEAKDVANVSPWHNDWGNSIAHGHTNAYVQWDLNDFDTTIFLSISGNNGNVRVSIEYSSMSLSVLEKQKIDKDTQSKI